MSYFIQIYYYIIHLITSRNTKGFGIHSPYLFQFVQYVILEKNPYYIFSDIEKQRHNLLNDKTTIHKTDFGTGQSKSIKISSVAAKSLCNPRKGQILYRTINYLDLNNLLELGTSFGISTAYMASSAKKRTCVTLEGCEKTARIAENTFAGLRLTNIEIITGNIDETIHTALSKLSTVDFVYIDANHSLEATYKYFECIIPFLSPKAVIVFDDIYWSGEMKLAWDKIKAHEKVTSTFDFYHFGIAFFNPDLHKKNYKLRY